jgi:molybdopterin molybdotransferase
VLDLETAVARILANLPPPRAEIVSLPAAAGRILTGSLTATIALPLFDNSAMDGYAVRAADVAGANATTPVRLRLSGRIAAGESGAGELRAGECVRLFTGAPLPRGADAVVMQEDTQVAGEDILILDAVQARENVRFQGEDVVAGATLAEAGAEITPGLMGLLGAAGVASVSVGRRPIVGLVTTGSELRTAGEVLAPGQIYESNRAMLAVLLERAGGVPRVFPLVHDTLADTRAALAQAFQTCDIVVTSGGVSVGEMDFVKAAFESLGGTMQFWKVAIRPGKPFVFGPLGDKFLFGLPGNPVSAFVTCLLLVRPALRRWQGAATISLPTIPAVLGETIGNASDRRHFVRVHWTPEGKVFSAGKQASHLLSSLARSEGLLDVPPHTTLAAGQNVTVLSGF